MPRRLRIAAIVGVALLLAGCLTGTPPTAPASPPLASQPAGPPQTAPSRPTPTPAPTPRTMAGQPLRLCTVNRLVAQCGSLIVPENPAKPAGRTIALNVAVVPALAATPLPDPLFVLAGGPGGAATITMAWTATTFSGVHAMRDIVLVDQRGTGASNELWLADPPDLTGMSTGAARQAVSRWASSAFGALDADASAYTTAVAMDDLDLVRAALGYDRINLYGASYGATAAQYYIRQHPDRLRTIVLDGATLLDVPVMERIAASSQRALDLLLARCETATACSNAYPDLRGELDAAFDRLDKSAVTTSVKQPYGSGSIVIDRNGFAGLIHQALIQSDLAARLPWLIHVAAAGDWDVVGQAVAQMAQPPEPGILLMSGMIRCSEAWARFDPAETRRASAGSYYLEAELNMAKGQFMACPFAPNGIVPANDAAPATGTMPVLLVVGDADPQDPPENIADAPRDFPNSRTVVVPGEGHTVGHLGCVPSVIDAFVAAGTTVGLDASCVALMRPPAFQLP